MPTFVTFEGHRSFEINLREDSGDTHTAMNFVHTQRLGARSSSIQPD